jgi:S-adenosylmethionine decarboxylase
MNQKIQHVAPFDFRGLHRLLTLKINDESATNILLLTQVEQFLLFSDEIIKNYALKKVGFSSHVFENNSYTVAVCLQESHI